MENSKEYIKNAIRTESTDFQSMNQRLMDDGTKRLMHSAFGLATEAGEFLDAMKKHRDELLVKILEAKMATEDRGKPS